MKLRDSGMIVRGACTFFGLGAALTLAEERTLDNIASRRAYAPTRRPCFGRHESARKAAGIPDLTFRMCRTTFATLFEGDTADAQAILGHHSAAFTLQVYRKPITARQQTAVEDLDGRLNVVPIRKGVA